MTDKNFSAQEDGIARLKKDFPHPTIYTGEEIALADRLCFASDVAALRDRLLAHCVRLAASLVERDEDVKKQAIDLAMADAQLRGMRDFLSGQPRLMPYDGSEVSAAKNSQLNFAWCVGYDVASESVLFAMMVDRADRSAERSQQCANRNVELEASLTLVRQQGEEKEKEIERLRALMAALDPITAVGDKQVPNPAACGEQAGER